MDEAKRVVIENFPFDQLPDAVREKFDPQDNLVLTVEVNASPQGRRTTSEIFDAMRPYRKSGEDPVERIRAVRGTSTRRDELHARIRRGEKI